MSKIDSCYFREYGFGETLLKQMLAQQAELICMSQWQTPLAQLLACAGHETPTLNDAASINVPSAHL
jgi:hypothetical protein